MNFPPCTKDSKKEKKILSTAIWSYLFWNISVWITIITIIIILSYFYVLLISMLTRLIICLNFILLFYVVDFKLYYSCHNVVIWCQILKNSLLDSMSQFNLLFNISEREKNHRWNSLVAEPFLPSTFCVKRKYTNFAFLINNLKDLCYLSLNLFRSLALFISLLKR